MPDTTTTNVAVRQAVLAHLAKSAPVISARVREGVTERLGKIPGTSASSVQMQLLNLQHQGYVTANRDGRWPLWSITAAGRSELSRLETEDG